MFFSYEHDRVWVDKIRRNTFKNEEESGRFVNWKIKTTTHELKFKPWLELHHSLVWIDSIALYACVCMHSYVVCMYMHMNM